MQRPSLLASIKDGYLNTSAQAFDGMSATRHYIEDTAMKAITYFEVRSRTAAGIFTIGQIPARRF